MTQIPAMGGADHRVTNDTPDLGARRSDATWHDARIERPTCVLPQAPEAFTRLNSVTMQHEWLLLETLGSEPAVVADGTARKDFIPISDYLRKSAHLSAVQTAVSETITTRTGLDSLTPKQKKIIRTAPVVMSDGRVHGVQLWLGPANAEPAERPQVGTVKWNLSTGVASSSSQAVAVRGGDPDAEPLQIRAFADDLPVGPLTEGEIKLIATVLRRIPGETVSGTLEIRRADGEPVSEAFAARMMLEEGDDGSDQLIGRSMTWVCPPDPDYVEPDSLARRLLEGMAVPGTQRAIVDLTSWKTLKWLDEPSTEYDWRSQVVHHGDGPVRERMEKEFASGSTSGVIRLANHVGDWVRLKTTIHRIEIEPGVFAGLVSVRRATDAEVAAELTPAPVEPKTEQLPLIEAPVPER